MALGGHAHFAALFRNDDDRRIADFRGAERGTVPRAEILAIHLRQRQDAPRRGDAPFADDHRPIMQRGVGKENGQQQFPGNPGVQHDPALHHITELHLAFQNDERPDTPLGEVLAHPDEIADHI